MSAIHVMPALEAGAVATVLSEWRQAGEEFRVLALLPDDEKENVHWLQRCCREAGVGLAGALFPELLIDARPVRQGALLLCLRGAPAPLLAEAISTAEGPERVALALTEYVEKNLDEDCEAALWCVFDALVPNIATHLDTWYLHLADRVSYAGVNAGNERFAAAPCLFDNERFIADGVLLQLLPKHPGAFLEHGYRVPEQVITATSAEHNRIVQIDWRPALEVYRQLLGSMYGVAVDRHNFYQYAVHFPFGIIRADGEVLVRIPVGLQDDGSIVCVGEIPPNALLALLDARSVSAEGTARLLADRQAQAAAPVSEMLTFYCAGRRMHGGNEVMQTELQALAADTGGQRIVGALSLGEIGGSQAGGYPLFHNATLVTLPWGDRG